MRLLILALAPLMLSGCIAKTALDVATLPVKVASKSVDALTTSQAEADQKRGREVRRLEQCMGREDRRARRQKREPNYERCEK